MNKKTINIKIKIIRENLKVGQEDPLGVDHLLGHLIQVILHQDFLTLPINISLYHTLICHPITALMANTFLF
jgi:hypothetical protein